MSAARSSFLRHIWLAVFDLPCEALSYRWGLCIGFVLATFPFLGSALSIFVCGMAVVAAVYLIAFRHTILPLRPRERLTAIILSAYVVIALVASLLHENRIAGLAATANNVGFLLMLPLLPVLRHYWRPYWSDWAMLACGIGGLCSGAVALLEVTYANGRAEAMTGNPLIFAYVAGLSGLFNLWLAFRGQRQMRYLHGAAAMSSVVALFASGGRLALLGFAAVASLGVIAGARSIRLRPTAANLFKLYVCLVATVVVFELVRDTSTFNQTLRRFEAIAVLLDDHGGGGGDNVRVRLSMQSAGLRAFIESPWLGHGRQNVMSVANGVSADDPPFQFTHLHNAYLTEAVASGVAGLLSFIFVLAAPLVATLGGRGPWRGVAVMLAIYTALYSLTNVGFGHDIKVFTYAALIVMLGALSRDSTGHSHAISGGDQMAR